MENLITTKQHYVRSVVYEDRLIAYIDILGFKEIVLGSDNTLRDKAFKFLEEIATMSGEAECVSFEGNTTPILTRPFGMASFGDKINYAITYEVSSFSDCIVISSPINTTIESHVLKFDDLCFGFIGTIKKFCLRTAEHGGKFLLRGAVTIGPLYHRGGTVYGTGLIEASETERSAAIYPRIVLSNKFIAKCKERHPLPESFIQDLDGSYYLDFMTWIFSRNYSYKWQEEIKESLKLYANDPVKLIKWQWLAKKYNSALNEWKVKKANEELPANLNEIPLSC